MEEMEKTRRIVKYNICDTNAKIICVNNVSTDFLYAPHIDPIRGQGKFGHIFRMDFEEFYVAILKRFACIGVENPKSAD